MRIIYMGSPEFAVGPMVALRNAGHEIVLAVSQPDKPQGRKKVLTPTAVKSKCLELNIPIITPANVNDSETFEILKEANADIMVVTAFGQILKEPLLNLTKYGAINIHGSILPKYRGAAPIQRAIMAGDKKTGVTIMHMDKGMDTGNMILKGEVDIDINDNSGDIYDKLAVISDDLIIKTLDLLEKGEAPSEAQNNDEATYAAKILRDDEKLDFSKTAFEIHNQIRGIAPFIGCSCKYGEEAVKIWKTEYTEETTTEPVGKVCGNDKKGFYISCKAEAGSKENSVLKVLEIQRVGKNKVAGIEFWRGQQNKDLLFN